MQIIAEEKDFLLVNKPPGLLTHRNNETQKETSLVELIATHIDFPKDDLRAGIVHRLDRSTGGLMVIAKNQAAKLQLQTLFANRLVVKRYYGLVYDRIAGGQGYLIHQMARDSRRRDRRVVRDTDVNDFTKEFGEQDIDENGKIKISAIREYLQTIQDEKQEEPMTNPAGTNRADRADGLDKDGLGNDLRKKQRNASMHKRKTSKPEIELKDYKQKKASAHANWRVAISHYQIIALFQESSLLDIEIFTGRTHQIRAQFSHLGHPVLGDTLYSKRFKHEENLMLQAYHLSFPNPFDGGKWVEYQLKAPPFFVDRVRLEKERFNETKYQPQQRMNYTNE